MDEPATWPSASHHTTGPSKVFKGKGACDRSKKWAQKRGYTMVAYDVSDTGAKNYLVSTWEDILSIHNGGKATGFPARARRWFYEGIFYGPCIPFFDLDGGADENPELLGELDERTRYVMRLVAQCLHLVFGIVVVDSDFIVLDASNAKKASRHLLVRKKGLYFANLYQHARFISVIRDQIAKAIRDPKKHPRAARIFTVLKTDKGMEKGIRKPLVDLSVYKSGLQLFRLYGNSKIRSPNRPLVRAKMCTFPMDRDDHDAMFLASFVGRVDAGDGTEPTEGLRVPDKFIGPLGIVCYGGDALTAAPGKKRRRVSKAGGGGEPVRKRHRREDREQVEAPDLRYLAVRAYLAENDDTKEWTVFKLFFYKTTARSGLYLVYPQSKMCAIRKKLLGRSEHGSGNPYVCLYRNGTVMYKCHSGSCEENPMHTMTLSDTTPLPNMCSISNPMTSTGAQPTRAGSPAPRTGSSGHGRTGSPKSSTRAASARRPGIT